MRVALASFSGERASENTIRSASFMTKPHRGAEGRPERLRSTRQMLVASALGVVAGVTASLLGAEKLAMPVTLASLALLGLGLHRFGRLGADPPSPSSTGTAPP